MKHYINNLNFKIMNNIIFFALFIFVIWLTGEIEKKK